MSVKINLLQGDITKVEGYDAIVNAANNTLLGGGGVDGCIHRAAGEKLLQECITLNGCETGEAKTTKAYNIPCKHIIHTVGPIYDENDTMCPVLLYMAYTNSMEEAKKHNCKKIAFPSISTGIYNYPIEDAAIIAIYAIKEFGRINDEDYEVSWVLFTPEDYEIYKKMLEVIEKGC